MKKSRYTEEQIAFALKHAETGTTVAEVIRSGRVACERADAAAKCVNRYCQTN